MRITSVDDEADFLVILDHILGRAFPTARKGSFTTCRHVQNEIFLSVIVSKRPLLFNLSAWDREPGEMPSRELRVASLKEGNF